MRRTAVSTLAALLLLAGCGEVVVGQAGGPATATVTVDAQVPAPCPATFPEQEAVFVPQLPTAETEGRLVPDADPVAALVCRYGDRSSFGSDRTPGAGPGELFGQVELTGGLGAVRHDLLLPMRLGGQERLCTVAGGALVPHLVRFDYADGVVWVSSVQDVNSCQDSGNGVFTSNAYLGDRLAASYDAGTWVPGVPGACTGVPGGRAGQESTLVPDGWTALTVCASQVNAGAPTPRPVAVDRARVLADALRELRGTPGSTSCSGLADTRYLLSFTYPQGPSVDVSVAPGCDPAVASSSLNAVPTAAQTERLEALLAAP